MCPGLRLGATPSETFLALVASAAQGELAGFVDGTCLVSLLLWGSPPRAPAVGVIYHRELDPGHRAGGSTSHAAVLNGPQFSPLHLASLAGSPSAGPVVKDRSHDENYS